MPKRMQTYGRVVPLLPRPSRNRQPAPINSLPPTCGHGEHKLRSTPATT